MNEEEHENNSSENGLVSEGLNEPLACDSAENSSQINSTDEAFRWTKGHEVREPCHSVTSQDQIDLFGSINLPMSRSSEIFNDSDKARVITEDRNIISSNKSSDDLCQLAQKSNITSSVDNNEELRH